jgi:hypothetical protein
VLQGTISGRQVGGVVGMTEIQYRLDGFLLYLLVNLELIKSSLLARERCFESMNKRAAQAEEEKVAMVEGMRI